MQEPTGGTMIRGLWVSAQALTPLERAQEILANNLANASTGGFRQDRVAFHATASATAEDGTASGEAAAAGTASGSAISSPSLTSRLDLTQGALETTEDSFHLAIQGPGFFAVQGPQGPLYTRDGTVHPGPDGTLLHQSGYPLLSEGGAITVPPGASFAVAADGSVFVNGSPAGKIRVVALPNTRGVTHAGAGLVSSETPAETDTSSRVVQGAAEAANVDPVLTMVDMMAMLHGYEADQRAILTQDGSLGRLIQWASG
jgi:flagellar basal-body rod protein FlgF